MMKTRKGTQSVSAYCSTEIPSLLCTALPEYGSPQHRDKSYDRGGAGLGSAEKNQSMRLMQEAKECASVSRRTKKDTWYQYVMDPEEKDIEFVDFSDRTMEEAEAEMQKWTTVPFKMFDAPLTRIVMIKMPDGFKRSVFPRKSYDRGRAVTDLFPERYYRALL